MKLRCDSYGLVQRCNVSLENVQVGNEAYNRSNGKVSFNRCDDSRTGDGN